jgi:8-hydroxy-5-deazaflavin:NADPH oxidoreductase
MRIGIVGTGLLGETLARLFLRAGHEVYASNARGVTSLAPLIAELGPRLQAATVENTTRYCDVLFLSAPWRAPEALPSEDVSSGRIVVDAMNPYRADGRTYHLGDTTSSEETARRLPLARLVKGFNTLHYRDLASLSRPSAPVDSRVVIPLAGQDDDAKAVVAEIVESIGFCPLDVGCLRSGGRLMQPGNILYNTPKTLNDARRALDSSSVLAA